MRAGSWPSILLLFGYGIVATSIVTQAVPVIGSIARIYPMSDTARGWIISLPSLVTALGALAGGWLIDRIGDRVALLAGCAMALAGDVVVFVSHDLATLVVGRLLEGGGYLALTVGAATMIMRTTEGHRRSTALGLWSSHTAVGIGVTLLAVAPLAAGAQAWRWAFGGHAGLLALLALATALLPRSGGPSGSGGSGGARRLSDILLVLRSPAPRRVALASCASALLQTGVMASLTTFLARAHGVTIPTAAAAGTAAEVVNAAGCLIAGPMLKRGAAPARLATVGAVTLLAGAVLLYLPASGFAAAALGVAIFALGIGITNSLIWSFVPAAAPGPQAMGATSGLVSQATYLGVLLGPPLVFATLHPGGWGALMALVAVTTVVQVVALPIWRQPPLAAHPLEIAELP